MANATGGFASTHYSYNAVGHRLTQNGNGTLTTYAYDIANRLTSVNGQAYTWDNNGNLTSDGLLTYSYDQANRLKQVTQGANTYTFTYNGVGDRLSQTVGITTTRYVLDPAAGLTQVLSDSASTYLYGNGRLAQYQTAMQYFGADGLGSVRQLYDASGQVLATDRYDPYGNVLTQSGTATSVFGYTGEQWDAATGLEYLRARYYSPAQGRFTTRDVWAGDLTSPMSYNAWLYAYANPLNRRDPSGRCDPDECTLLQDYSGTWYTENTGTEVMWANSWRANPNQYYDMDLATAVDCRSDSTCTLYGTASAHYWSLPTRDEAFDLWYDAGCDALCKLAKATWLAPLRYYFMCLYDLGGNYGGIEYRTQLKQSEVLRQGIPFVIAATGGLSPAAKGWSVAGGKPLYRGGTSLVARKIDVVIDKETKMVLPQKGISLNIDPAQVQQFGGAYPVQSIPEALKIIQRGKPGHFEIVPAYPMPFEKFNELLQEVELLLGDAK